jgi:hypothetical protein
MDKHYPWNATPESDDRYEHIMEEKAFAKRLVKRRYAKTRGGDRYYLRRVFPTETHR